ncbi:DUF1772 domain-containing protein [Rhodococcus sp. (in: high G+C Gram-positive bacteria)]|uniref:DUF1772 domain-containing protein n=1 Tax=unclassified Rhodococcus (in: high G+C Gram-positive bacteria) TaxID=192944 RepID=UPI0019EDF0D1|nr:DUF1772 domain-containing protein [Rhodococcus sp. (in: high G+C Gram-positive bacteria)]MBF0659939.1 DUF1772 domain-containing protein [Rhodococcus sp. (in: high G+C Gram-positive bacteria)]
MTHNTFSPRTAVIVAYSWVTLIAFGAILTETVILYPNVFHDPPASLDLTVEFMSEAGPSDFFPPLGALTVALAAASVFLLRRDKKLRPWAVASLISLVFGEFAFSAFYFWPRNTIMFDEGTAVHSVEVLRQTAVEFETGHWVRLTMSGVTAVLAFVALFKALTARTSTPVPVEARVG